VGSGQLDQAQQVLERLVSDVPDCPQRQTLQRHLSEARREAWSAEVETNSRKVKDLMAAGAFEEALRQAQAFHARFPDSCEARSLIELVEREANAFGAEQRRQLYSQIGFHADARRWRQALAAAHRFLEVHSRCPEADLVRAQLPTLTDNARIEEVRELRDRIRDLINRRRFPEAFELARDLVARFPQTAAAEELRQQMDKLAERAGKSR
jgi:leucyl aminopeptidase